MLGLRPRSIKKTWVYAPRPEKDSFAAVRASTQEFLDLLPPREVTRPLTFANIVCAVNSVYPHHMVILCSPFFSALRSKQQTE